MSLHVFPRQESATASPIVTRYHRRGLILVGSLLALFCVNGLIVRAGERPNIVLVMADDQGWGDMSYNGHPVLHTPNFDQAAASGLRFERFYAAAPVCSPTRASVLTGRNPNRMGVFQWGYPMRPQEITLAEVLKDAGYATGHFGKWHLGSVRRTSASHPGKNGFDAWLSAPNFFDNDPILSREGDAVQTKGESSMVTANAALEWIGEQAVSDNPFFAVVWFGSPHAPHQAAESDREQYPGERAKLQNFYGEITGMDRAFGHVRESLEKLGIRENTLLWYCSDNGALRDVGSTGGRRGHKGQIYEGGLLVPAILEWPARIPSPRATRFRCSTCDIFPTILEVADVKRQRQTVLDGISLVPLIENRDDSRQKPMGFWDVAVRGISTPSATWMGELLEAQRSGGDLPPHESVKEAHQLPDEAYPTDSFPGHAAWIDRDWKLHRIQNQRGEVRWELYNLQTSPKEMHDVSADHPDRVEAMSAELTDWLRSVVNSLNGEDYERND